MSERRKSDFKKTTKDLHTTEVLRAKNIEVRKQKRDSALLVKRIKLLSDAELSSTAEWSFSKDDILILISDIKSNNPSKCLDSLKKLRKLLCVINAPVQICTESGLIPVLANFLTSNIDDLVTETLWCLTNIATAEYEFSVSVFEAVPNIIQILMGTNCSLQEQCCWALGNLAGECDEFRSILLANGALKPMSAFLHQCMISLPPSPPPLAYIHGTNDEELTLLEVRIKTVTWAISNLCRGNSSTLKTFTDSGTVPLLLSLCLYIKFEVSVEAIWSLTFLTAKEDTGVTYLLEQGLMETLIEAFSRSNVTVPSTVAIIRCLGNISSGPDSWIQYFQNFEIKLIEKFLQCLRRDSHTAVIKEALWVISNLLSTSLFSTLTTTNPNNKISLLVHITQLLVNGESPYAIKREAVYAIERASAKDISLLFALFYSNEVFQEIIELMVTADVELCSSCIRIIAAYCKPAVLATGTGTARTATTGAINGGYSQDIIHRSLSVLEFCRQSSLLISELETLLYGEINPELYNMVSALLAILYDEDNEEQIEVQQQQQSDSSSNDTTLFNIRREDNIPPSHPSVVGMGRGKSLTQPAWMTNGGFS